MPNDNVPSLNDARVLGDLDLNDPLYQTPFKWAVLKNKKSDWKTSEKIVTVADALKVLSCHPESRSKDGLAVALAEVVEGQRRNEKVKAPYAIGLDLDKGAPPEKIDSALAKFGSLAVRYTTFNNGTTATEFARDKIIDFAGDNKIDTALMRRYMTEEKYDPSVVETVELADAQFFGDNGIVVRVSHAPMAKNRVIVFLSEPFEIAKVAKKQRDAIAMWRKIPVALAERMGLADALDTSAIDPARLFYLPRHAPGAEWDAVIHVGPLCNWRELELDNPWDVAAGEVAGERKGGKSKTDAGRDLADWSRKYAHGFQIADAIRDHCPERIREDKGNKIEIECPNDGAHSNAGDPDDRACMAVNAGEGTAPVFVIKCQHDNCQGMTSLDMLGLMGEAEWFPRETLESDDYNAIVERAPIPESKDQVAQATEEARAQYKDAIEALSTKSPSEEIDRVIKLVAQAQLGRTAKEAAILRLKAKTAFGMQLLRDELYAAEEPYRPKPKPKTKRNGEAGGEAKSTKERFDYLGSFDFEDACDFCIDAIKRTSHPIQGAEGHNRLPTFVQLDGRPARLNMSDQGQIEYEQLSEAAYWSEMSKRVSFVKKSDGAESPGEIVDKDVARHLYQQSYDLLPKAPEILHTPTFLKSGSLLETEGYHRGNRSEQLNCVLQLNGLQVPPIANPPTLENVEESVAWLKTEILGDFPFWDYDRDSNEGREPGEANALAMLVTPFMRRMIEGPTPLFLVTKPQPKIGGTLLATTPILLFEGASAKPSITYSKNDEEFNKNLLAAYMERRSYMFFDNVSELRSQSLLIALTGDKVGGRKLGHSVLIERVNDLNWVSSGINPFVSAEMDRRLCRIHLFDRTPEGEERKYRHADFKQFLADNRALAIHHILTLIEYWHVKGAEDFTDRKQDSFERWSRKVGGVLQACGVKGFLNNRPTLILDPERDAENELLRAWIVKFTVGKTVTVADAFKWAKDAEFGIIEGKSTKEERTNFGDSLRRMQQRRFKHEGRDYVFRMALDSDGVACFSVEALETY